MPINEIHALEIKLEHRFSFNLGTNPRSEFEDPLEASDSAACDHEATRDEDGVEQVKGDLAVRCEPIEFGESAGVVGSDGRVQEVHGFEHVVVFLCTTFFGLEGCCVVEEFGVEGYEEFWVQLRMEVNYRTTARIIEILTSRGALFQETPGQDWMTSLQALRIYSLFTTSLNVGSACSCLGKVRTILNSPTTSVSEDEIETSNNRTRS